MMTNVQSNPYRVLGTRPIRPDGVDKVTGKALYGADIRLPGTVFAAVLRSPHAHARIRDIDASAAINAPGVLAVVTGRELPLAEDLVQALGEGTVNLRDLSENVLATEKVLYKGHAVAALAAATRHEAEAALSLIKVTYELLDPVLNVRDAMRADAPILDPRRRTTSIAGSVSDAPTNVARYFRFEDGDPDAAFADADDVVEHEWTTSTVHQGYIEPQTATASWSADGSVTVWTSTQAAFGVRSQLSSVLKLPISKIRVVPMEIGGGFGGKLSVFLEPVVAMLSRKTGRPVRATMSRAEVFEATGPYNGTLSRMKMARKGDRITAVDASLMYEAGAFQGSLVGPACMTLIAPYEIPNFRIEGFDVVVNKPRTGSYRAPGANTGAFVSETLIDELCERGDLDPLEFRLKNCAHEGTRQVTGLPLPRVGVEECLQAAFDHPHYSAPIEGPNRGRGVAAGYWFNGGFQSSVVVSVNLDGTLNLVEGSIDIGGSRASLAMQLAETVGIPYENIRVSVVDTDAIPYNDFTAGSRTTFATGLAVCRAGEAICEEMKRRAARLWSVADTEVTYDTGTFSCVSDSSKSMSFAELASKSGQTGGPIASQVSLTATAVAGAIATHIVDVEVDPETGKVDILRYTAVQDVGKAVHPSYVEGQIQGGVAQGSGWALNEEYCYDEAGRLLNASYLDYRMPTTLDLPFIDTVLVEVPNPNHPYGVRGVAEVPIVPPLAAIANAVHNATGHRFYALPLSPRRIVTKLQGLAED